MMRTPRHRITIARIAIPLLLAARVSADPMLSVLELCVHVDGVQLENMIVIVEEIKRRIGYRLDLANNKLA
jgi:hypothetical protein